MRYSATTVMMPQLGLEEQADLLQRLGFDGVEWRVRRVPADQRGKGFSEWGEHKNDLTPENFAAEAARMKKVAADHGLAIAGIASAASADDLEQVKLLAEGSAACGAPFFRVWCPRWYDRQTPYQVLFEEGVEAFGKALDAIKGYGVKIILEIHGNTIHVSASLAHRLVSHWSPDRIGCIFDPQNMVSDGFETTEIAVELLGPYLAHVHAGGHRPVEKGRDEATGTVEWEWPGCPMSEGLYDFRRLLKQLKAVSYRGFISIEDFRPAPLEEKLRDGIGYLKRVEATL